MERLCIVAVFVSFIATIEIFIALIASPRPVAMRVAVMIWVIIFLVTFLKSVVDELRKLEEDK